MIDRLQILIFTPIMPGCLQPATLQSVVNQQTHHWLTWEIGRCNPYPPPDLRNVLAQYSYARELCLSGPYDALLTVEEDMILPPHAVQILCETPAPVVYGTYLLRHGDLHLNAWQYIGQTGLGMSLDRYPLELQKYNAEGVGRVSGVGFGCTLIRRTVLETIPFRAHSSQGHGCDSAFALDCIRLGITQLARFDVRCGHIHKEEILDVEQASESTVTCTVLQPVNILLDGSGVTLAEGETVDLPAKQADWLTSLGYVKPVETEKTAAKKK